MRSATKAKILSRAERPLNRTTVDLDIKKLLDTKYFSDVSTTLTRPAEGDGVILTFTVVEMPILNEGRVHRPQEHQAQGHRGVH